jgi:hypothetical protein
MVTTPALRRTAIMATLHRAVTTATLLRTATTPTLHRKATTKTLRRMATTPALRRVATMATLRPRKVTRQESILADDITEALHQAVAAERRAFALKRAADPMGRGRTSPAEIKKFRDATAAHDAAKAEVARLRKRR